MNKRIKADPSRAKQELADRVLFVNGGASKRRRVVRPPENSLVTERAGSVPHRPRDAMIADAAYFRSSQRGFEPGHEVDDWLAAESDIDVALARMELPAFPA
jgi:hypothetical protein